MAPAAALCRFLPSPHGTLPRPYAIPCQGQAVHFEATGQVEDAPPLPKATGAAVLAQAIVRVANDELASCDGDRKTQTDNPQDLRVGAY